MPAIQRTGARVSAQPRLEEAICERFRIGYAPDAWNEVLRRFGATDEARHALLAAGLIIERETPRAGRALVRPLPRPHHVSDP